MNSPNRNAIADVLSVLACAAAAVLALMYGFMAALFPMALAILLYKAAGQSRGGQVSGQSLESYLRILLSEYKVSKRLAESVERSSGIGFSFSKELRAGITRYRNGLRASAAFSRLLASPDRRMHELASIIADGLDSGIDSTPALSGLYYRLSSSNSNGLRDIGKKESAFFVSRMGSALFFPVFAGISTDIIKFSYSVNAGLGTEFLQGVTIVLLGYMLITNITNARFGAPATGLRRLAGASVYSAFALLLFQLSSYLAVNFLVS